MVSCDTYTTRIVGSMILLFQLLNEIVHAIGAFAFPFRILFEKSPANIFRLTDHFIPVEVCFKLLNC